MCGGKVLHALPFERREDNAEAKAHYAHLESVETFERWLRNLPWKERVWTCGSTILTQGGAIAQTEEPLRSELLATLDRCLADYQHTDGLWGDPKRDEWWSRISGSYKIFNFLSGKDRPLPRAEAMKATALDYLENRPYDNSIVLFNTIKVLLIVHEGGHPLSDEQKFMLLPRTTATMRTFQCDDGGFGTHRDRPTPKELGKVLGKNVIEGNANASGLLYSTRNRVYRIITGDNAPQHARSEELRAALAAAAFAR